MTRHATPTAALTAALTVVAEADTRTGVIVTRPEMAAENIIAALAEAGYTILRSAAEARPTDDPTAYDPHRPSHGGPTLAADTDRQACDWPHCRTCGYSWARRLTEEAFDPLADALAAYDARLTEAP